MGKQWAIPVFASILIFGTIVLALTILPNDVYANPSFTTPDNLTNNAVDSRIPDVAVSGSDVHVVYHEDVGGNLEVFYKRSIDGGATFSIPVNLSNDPGPSQFAKVAASGKQVYVAWEKCVVVVTPPCSGRSSAQVAFKRSIDGGNSFVAGVVNLTNLAKGSPNLGLFAEVPIV